jgi:uncharacterized protein YqgV (UPF0045/DUF77 family)
MHITAELSLYPLTEDYEDVVIAYIRALRETPDIQLKTGGMSTMIAGDMNVVMQAIKSANMAIMSGGPKAVLVAKFLNGDAFTDPNID